MKNTRYVLKTSIMSLKLNSKKSEKRNRGEEEEASMEIAKES